MEKQKALKQKNKVDLNADIIIFMNIIATSLNNNKKISFFLEKYNSNSLKIVSHHPIVGNIDYTEYKSVWGKIYFIMKSGNLLLITLTYFLPRMLLMRLALACSSLSLRTALTIHNLCIPLYTSSILSGKGTYSGSSLSHRLRH